jgi:4-hydroxybenzoate polyprenyltransferase
MISILKLVRILSWVKNIFVFVPLVFSKHLLDISYLSLVLVGFLAFSVTSSAVYVFNDLIDLEKDRLHPLNKNRPLPSGSISKKEASFILFLLLIAVVAFSATIKFEFVLLLWSYILINILYSLVLKRVVIADLFCISAGFLIRVVSGAVIISVYLSNWLILTTIFLSLFLAVMKRRVEIANKSSDQFHREVLKDYSLDFIDLMAAITGACVIISYALYTVAERTIHAFGSEELVFTTLFVIFGIFRYMFLAIKKNKGYNIAEVLISDIPMIVNVIAFIFVSLYIIYLK